MLSDSDSQTKEINVFNADPSLDEDTLSLTYDQFDNISTDELDELF